MCRTISYIENLKLSGHSRRGEMAHFSHHAKDVLNIYDMMSLCMQLVLTKESPQNNDKISQSTHEPSE